MTTTWSPGRAATFGDGEWIVTVTNTGDVRIWRNGPHGFAYTMLEEVAMDLRRALGEPSITSRGGWTIGINPNDIQIEFWPQRHVLGIAFAATLKSAADLREGLRQALYAIHCHHHPESTLAEFEAKLVQKHGVRP